MIWGVSCGSIHTQVMGQGGVPSHNQTIITRGLPYWKRHLPFLASVERGITGSTCLEWWSFKTQERRWQNRVTVQGSSTYIIKFEKNKKSVFERQPKQHFAEPAVWSLTHTSSQDPSWAAPPHHPPQSLTATPSVLPSIPIARAFMFTPLPPFEKGVKREGVPETNITWL